MPDPHRTRRGHPRCLAFGIGVDDGRGEYAADVPGRGHLTREAVAESPVFGKLRPDHLDGEVPAKVDVSPLEHSPHPAAGNFTDQVIAARMLGEIGHLR